MTIFFGVLTLISVFCPQNNYGYCVVCFTCKEPRSVRVTLRRTGCDHMLTYRRYGPICFSFFVKALCLSYIVPQSPFGETLVRSQWLPVRAENASPGGDLWPGMSRCRALLKRDESPCLSPENQHIWSPSTQTQGLPERHGDDAVTSTGRSREITVKRAKNIQEKKYYLPSISGLQFSLAGFALLLPSWAQMGSIQMLISVQLWLFSVVSTN